MDRIIDLARVSSLSHILHKHDKKIVLVGGCFDILHHGHISFLTQSKKLGDILIIALEHDQNVKALKGPSRPFQKQSDRAELLSSLRMVDYVILLPPMSSHSQYESLVTNLHPDILSVTEGDTHLTEKKKHGERVGATIHIVPQIQTHSTSELAKKVGLE